MSEFKKQFRGYSVQQVDSKIDDYQAELASLKQQVASLTDELDHVKEQNSLLQHRFKKCPKIFWIQSIIRKSLILLTKKMKITKYDERDSL